MLNEGSDGGFEESKDGSHNADLECIREADDDFSPRYDGTTSQNASEPNNALGEIIRKSIIRDHSFGD